MSVLKECPSFKGVIYASNKGDIYKKNSKGVLKPLKQRYDKDGYLLVSFRINGIPYTQRSHRLVAEAFIPNPKNLPYVNHKKGKKDRNVPSNLEWCTARYNRVHAHENDLAFHYKITVVNTVTLEVAVFNSYREVAKYIGCKSEAMVKYLCDVVRPIKGKYKHLSFIREEVHHK